MTAPATPTRYERQIARRAPPLLAEFNTAGVLDAVDVHAAAAAGRLLGEDSPEVLLAAALAVRATRFGHVCVDLANLPETVVVDGVGREVVDALSWPDPGQWARMVAASPAAGDGDPGRPLALAGGLLYLQRYLAYERRVATALRDRAAAPPEDIAHLAGPLADLFPDRESGAPNLQRQAAAMAAGQRLTVIAGGPGTGKTHTVARLLALLIGATAASGARPPAAALAAPTGKAAARMTDQIREAAAAPDLPGPIGERLREIEAATLHRLLGFHPERGRFRHSADNPLPHDLVVVDEMSMVSLPMAARLLEAVRPEAALVLVGDPDQLASIEAGSVLADLVGPAAGSVLLSPAARERLEPVAGPLPDGSPGPVGGLGDHVVALDQGFRFGAQTGIARVADAVRAGDADGTIDLLGSVLPDVVWVDTTDRPADEVPELVEAITDHAAHLAELGREGRVDEALAALEDLAVLCAHRRGRSGVHAWVARIEQHLGLRGPYRAEWYPGRPVMVTVNNYRLGLFNGDIGVTVAAGDGPVVVFPGAEGARPFGPARLAEIETVHAMTIHKSQGSQFEQVVVILPDEESPLLTRELLYTALTRARSLVTVAGSEAAIRSAVGRRVARASGLGAALWGDGS